MFTGGTIRVLTHGGRGIPSRKKQTGAFLGKLSGFHRHQGTSARFVIELFHADCLDLRLIWIWTMSALSHFRARDFWTLGRHRQVAD